MAQDLERNAEFYRDPDGFQPFPMQAWRKVFVDMRIDETVTEDLDYLGLPKSSMKIEGMSGLRGGIEQIGICHERNSRTPTWRHCFPGAIFGSMIE